MSAFLTGRPGNTRTQLFISEGSEFAMNNLGFTWMWQMQQNEIVQFYVSDHALSSYPYYPLTFTAELVEEE